jgi:hypothetical protein
MVNNSADRPPTAPRADGTTPMKPRLPRAKPALTSPDWSATLEGEPRAGAHSATVTPLKVKPLRAVDPKTLAVIAALENEIADMKSGKVAPAAFILLTIEELGEEAGYVVLGLNRAEVVGNLFALATDFSMGIE